MDTNKLTLKLSKMNIPYKILDINGYNKDIEFQINGLIFKAGFNADSPEITDFCREICYDNNEQETQRRFFDNFNKVLKYANVK